MPAHARGRRQRGGRPTPGPGRAGLGSGFGFPAWFFLNQVSRVRVASIPEPDPLCYPDPNRSSWIANSCDYWVEPLQRFRPNRCNLLLGSDPLAPPRAL